MTYADHLKIYKAKCDMRSNTVRYYEELGVADEIEVLDFLNVSHEFHIALIEYLDYFSECVREDVNLDWEA